MSVNSQIDMCVVFGKTTGDVVQIRPEGILNSQYTQECNDNIDQKAYLSIEKRLFGASNVHQDDNDGFNWFNGSTSDDNLLVTEPFHTNSRRDVIIKANKENLSALMNNLLN